MVSSKKHSVKLSKVLSYVVVILLLAAICGCLAYFTNGFTSDFKTFYVESNGNTYLSNTSGYILSAEKENRFDVKYTFSALSKEVNGYSVKIVPNVTNETDFDFKVGDDVYSFGAEPDLTKGFDIVYYDDYFIIDGNYSMQSVLNKLYPESVVTFEENEVKWDEDLYTLLVYSYNEKSIISIGFHNLVSVMGVELPSEIKF
jgi:hypothetical protein